MNLEDQVCSLDLAKRLKELGVKQESAFYWRVEIDDGEEYPEVWFGECTERAGVRRFSAFTVAELGEMMKGKGMGVTAYVTLSGPGWWISSGEWIVEKQKSSHTIHGETKRADALAKLLIYLIKVGGECVILEV